MNKLLIALNFEARAIHVSSVNDVNRWTTIPAKSLLWLHVVVLRK